MLLAQFRLLPDSASTFVPQVDALFLFIIGISVFLTVLVFGLMTYFCIRYRRVSEDELPGPMHGNTTLEIAWSVIPLFIVMGMFAWGAYVYIGIIRPPANAREIYVVGRQWMWKIQHPEGQREINTLHVPAGEPVRLIITAEDVLHSFYIPAFRTKQDAVPGRYSSIWFTATEPGEYHLFCAEYCGTEHSKMVGKVIVMPPDKYQEWLDQGPDGSMALEGKKLFSKLQCITCHGYSAQGRAPMLEDLVGKRVNVNVGNENGPQRSVLVDDAYLRRSIREPAAEIVTGWRNIMPAYTPDQLNNDDLNNVVAYIKSLKQGQTPGRVEDTPQPVPPQPAQPPVQPKGEPK